MSNKTITELEDNEAAVVISDDTVRLLVPTSAREAEVTPTYVITALGLSMLVAEQNEDLFNLIVKRLQEETNENIGTD